MKAINTPHAVQRFSQTSKPLSQFPRRALAKKASMVVERLEERTLLSFGGFSYPTVVDSAGFPPREVALGDINRDGKLDMVSVDPGNSAIRIFMGDGRGGFSPATPGYRTVSGPGSASPLLVDLNRDMKLDVVVPNWSGPLAVFLGNGDGTFGSRADYSVGSFGAAVVAGDFNADGNPDLAATGFNSGHRVTTLMNNGNGTFTNGPSVLVDDVTSATLDVGDIDGDNRLDLLVSHYATNSISVLLGNGNGTFRSGSRIVAGVAGIGLNPRELKLRDMNGDSKLDLVVANETSNTVSVGWGNGLGAFGPFQQLAVGASPRSVAVGDVDVDGRPDIVTANFSSDNVTLFRGNGGGAFLPAQNFAAGSASSSQTAPTDVALGDLNGDGLLDVAVGHGFVEPFPGASNDGTSTRVTILLANPANNGPNLSITNAYLTDANGNRVDSPLIGSLVYVQVEFQTQNLPAGSQYVISQNIDGYTLRHTIDWGAGRAGTGSWVHRWGAWPVAPGQHSVNVMLDASGSIQESSESDNSRSFTVAAATPNLSITNAYLTDAIGNRVDRPAVGSFVYVQVEFQTRDLPLGSQYVISQSIDGYALRHTINWGAGLRGTASWVHRWGAWPVNAGQHTVNVMLDASGNIQESSELDNSRIFTFLAGNSAAAFSLAGSGTVSGAMNPDNIQAGSVGFSATNSTAPQLGTTNVGQDTSVGSNGLPPAMNTAVPTSKSNAMGGSTRSLGASQSPFGFGSLAPVVDAVLDSWEQLRG